MSRKTRSRRERERDEARTRAPNAVARWIRRRFDRPARTRTDNALRVRIPAAEFAARHGFRESAVVSRIRNGIYDGVEVDGEWFVLRRSELGEIASERSLQDRDLSGGVQASPQREAPRLPWRTDPGPARRAPRVATIVFLVGLLIYGALYVLDLHENHPLHMVPFVAFLVTPLVMFYGALRSGVTWSPQGTRFEFGTSPGTWLFYCMFYAAMSLILFLAIAESLRRVLAWGHLGFTP